MVEKITEWFENEDYLEAVLKKGIDPSNGERNVVGVLHYLVDDTASVDAKIISSLVRRYNNGEIK